MPSTDPAWTFIHSVECGVPLEFAWKFWTNVENWKLDADVVSVEIDGPFAAGARGMTVSKSNGPIQWRVAEVVPGRAVIEFPLPGALGQFVWTFEDLGKRTRLAQHCSLAGDQAEGFAKAVGPSLEAGIPAGMQKLCDSMEGAWRAR